MQYSITKLFLLFTVLILGISAGAMLTEVVILVSYWKSMPAQDFLIWFQNHDALLTSFFGKLQTGGLLLTLACVVILKVRKQPFDKFLLSSLLLSIAIILMFFLYFKSANTSFATGTIPLANVPEELVRWGQWQWGRTTLGMLAFITALFASSFQGRKS
jgi:hypothetical protein